MAHFVCSDIHGFFDRYEKLLKEINFSDDDILYVLGDCIDRGEDGIKVLQDISCRKNVVLFIGNHEHMMLDYLDNVKQYGVEQPFGVWFRSNNGGKITYQKYCLLTDNEKEEINNVLNDAYIQKAVEVNGHKFMLCHTFFKQDVEEYKFREADSYEKDTLLWCSPFRNDDLYMPPVFYKKDYTYIIGHVPTIKFGEQAPLKYNNIINIDGGCAISSFYPEHGSLCCIKLEDILCDNPTVFNIR